VQMEGEAPGDQIGDALSSERHGSSELHGFGRLEEYLSERFDQVFSNGGLE
jgi:hypothetical protein